MTTDPPPAVVLDGITRRYPGVVANSDVRLTVRRGEVHAVCGENGAGKSTLMRILYGMEIPDAGTITVNGVETRFASPAGAIAAGIGMVHQHFMLVDNFTVLENLVLGAEHIHGIGARAKRALAEIGDRTGLRVDPAARAGNLGVADRQRLEILKVLYRGARIIILDEPTAVLVPSEVDELFAVVRAMARDGYTFVFISHKLDEVLDLADRVTVLRRGTTVLTVEADALDAGRLAELMIGGELPAPRPAPRRDTRHDVVTVTNMAVADPVSGRRLLDPVSFRIEAGQVLGVAGVEGNGQVPLVEAIAGLRKHSGSVQLVRGPDTEAVELAGMSALRRREAGLGYIADDRTRYSILASEPLWRNRILGFQGRLTRARSLGLLLDRDRARHDTRTIVADFGVRTPGIDTPIAALSGGNQQKMVTGRELSGDPVLLIAAHPTRGVDIGAQRLIWDRLRRAQSRGLAVLLISADLDELIGLSDTVMVLLRGRLTTAVPASALTPATLGRAMLGASDPDVGR